METDSSSVWMATVDVDVTTNRLCFRGWNCIRMLLICAEGYLTVEYYTSIAYDPFLFSLCK